MSPSVLDAKVYNRPRRYAVHWASEMGHGIGALVENLGTLPSGSFSLAFLRECVFFLSLCLLSSPQWSITSKKCQLLYIPN